MAFNSLHNSDLEIWQSFKKGDKIAFAKIYQLHAKSLLNYGVTLRISSNLSVIEDCLQDLFLELWQSRENLADTDSIKFYLFRALKNKLMRTVKYDFSKSTDEIDETLGGDLFEASIERILIEEESQKERLERLKVAFDGLSQRQREVINLKYYHQFSNAQIAEIMELNYASVGNLIQKALFSLRQSIHISIHLFLLIFSSFIR
ncbi:RNA polymerase sigma factor [Flectobacillus sp. BAB-3569]|uniref:RNA polymerase sigma factor n=1 Tax=Flectobacillus sp. BAB-3569 TaxID=1509483 RepID=UPI001594E76C|nr:sigma-70 family RNA polymerase sigma factor [Flectobacillus sp. BAB-3569]